MKSDEGGQELDVGEPLRKQGDISAVWRRYAASRAEPDREILVLHYLPLVQFVCGRLGAGLPRHVPQGDLMSAGAIGLMQAVERFDVDRGIPFEGFALTRIRGAMIDELRSWDWAPRAVRARHIQVDRAMHELVSSFHRVPTDEELAKVSGLAVNEVAQTLQETNVPMTIPLDEVIADSMPADDDPFESAAAQVSREVLMAALRDLPERERDVIALYYLEELTLSEVGDILGVTQSRVSQLRARGVTHLSALVKWGNGVAAA
jgi:RNA polymerase sigma factor for flagellar operon FliA